MVDTIKVPEKDNFQVITEHDSQNLIYDPSYLDIPRTDGIIFIQITLNEGRTLELKKAFYQQLAQRLHGELGVRIEDVFINLVEVKKIGPSARVSLNTRNRYDPAHGETRWPSLWKTCLPSLIVQNIPASGRTCVACSEREACLSLTTLFLIRQSSRRSSRL